MNMMDMLAAADGGQGFETLARQFGVSSDQARAVAASVLPALSSGVKRQATSEGGMTTLAGFLRANDAAGAHDAPEAHLEAAETQGQQFLGGVFGDSKGDVMGAVAEQAAGKAGVGADLVMRMVPVIASMVLGGMQKRESEDGALNDLVGSMLSGQGGALGALMGALGGASTAGGASGGGLMGALGGMFGGAKAAPATASAPGGDADQGGLGALLAMFDADGDGSVADDLLERFMKR